MLCYITSLMLCHITYRYVMSCHVMLCYDMCYVMLFNIGHVMSCYVMLCFDMCHVIFYTMGHVILYNICHVML